ncbi:MAG: hypothetical protein ACXAEU_12395 [Candidatus Hodarchaeales archaeon]|jgi:hypothetical protein
MNIRKFMLIIVLIGLISVFLSQASLQRIQCSFSHQDIASQEIDNQTLPDYTVFILLIAVVATFPEIYIFRILSSPDRRKSYRTKATNLVSGLVREINLVIGRIDIEELRTELQTGSDVTKILSGNYSEDTLTKIVTVLGECKKYGLVAEYLSSEGSHFHSEVIRKAQDVLKEALPFSEQVLLDCVNKHTRDRKVWTNTSTYRAIEVLIHSTTPSIAEYLASTIDFKQNLLSDKQRESLRIDYMHLRGKKRLILPPKLKGKVEQLISGNIEKILLNTLQSGSDVKNILAIDYSPEKLKEIIAILGDFKRYELVAEGLSLKNQEVVGKAQKVLRESLPHSEQALMKYIDVHRQKKGAYRTTYLHEEGVYRAIEVLLNSNSHSVAEYLASLVGDDRSPSENRSFYCLYCGNEYPYDTSYAKCVRCGTKLRKPRRKQVYCPNCGDKYHFDTSYEKCVRCGTKLRKPRRKQVKKTLFLPRSLEKEVKQFISRNNES